MRDAGSVIIPAHNEASVLGWTLAMLEQLAATGELEVIVVCNGCTDGTASVARAAAGVQVLEIDEASKPAALNAADAAARLWPRIYLDADIEISPVAVRDVLSHLRTGSALAARPAREYDLTGASWPVRAFYRARGRIPALDDHLWGAGTYAVSRDGRARFATFPARTGDDLWIDRLYGPHEKAVVDTTPVRVRTPRTVGGLLAILRRVYRGNSELAHAAEVDGARLTTAQTALGLLRSVRSLRSATDEVVYVVLVLLGRALGARGSTAGWERDESSRGASPRAQDPRFGMTQP